LLVVPVFVAARKLRTIPEASDRWLVAALALIVAFNATDLLPNGLFSYFPYYFAGVLMGVLEGGKWASKKNDDIAQKHADRRRERRERAGQA
jgi:hypothetical protein